ncbi:MAG: hypothetical protein MJZ12_01300 [Prevotella sp.]|nr:hypothetical protein [Prevotella sp.]
MKHKGNKFEYEADRNRDLMRVYREQLSKCSQVILSEIFRKVVDQPSSQFWVTERRCAIVLSRMFNGDDLSTMRYNNREMYQEIFSRAKKMRQQDPTVSYLMMAFTIINQPAPKFYLTPDSARVIITRCKREIMQQDLQTIRRRFCHHSNS